ncbi:hypothetical protein [Robertkochia sediminum]|uniref:hypothetical protein n=1 Tax=Robertkochia sediminum TaxID=2785326 RepID=UPI00193343C7|nr:hypothetical protein [Robertkochia sediminum]MBL7472628.1 hypothetical protein [Robertkochia sediminum]
MKRLICKPFNQVFTAITLLLATGVAAQIQTKSYSEKFDVDKAVQLEVNTAYTDLIFDTWNRNQVAIEATIEIEGVSEEEAQEIFKQWGFKAVGNSSKVTVSTGTIIHGNRHAPSVVFLEEGENNFTYEFQIPDVDAIVAAVPENFVMPEMPPMPPMNFRDMDFDFEAYEKEGEAYLEKWKAEFKEKFDDESQAEFEAWGKEVAEIYKDRKGEMAKVEEEMQKVREEMAKTKEERERMREEVRKQIKENQAEIRILVEEARREAHKARANAAVVINGFRANGVAPGSDGATVSGYRRIDVKPGSDSKVFFYTNEGEAKNLKIKRTIKIKAPKGAKLDLNVRHGEIKLAENYKNINATLSYTRLHAPMVDGKQTKITAAYSPMLVDHWKEGALNVSYAKALELKKVHNINMDAKSSNVLIEELSGNAIINGSFGDLVINKFNDDFVSLDVVIENSDATLVLPEVAFDIYARSTFSRMKVPASLDLNVNQLQNSKQIKGYSKSAGSGRSIHIIANYSNVNFQGI